ncbi:MAG: hypothetical protein Q8R28_11420 [Dehalococcoidia bacterium]|nr:hypothetical protein [Dehalococcoidia bacterium]
MKTWRVLYDATLEVRVQAETQPEASDLAGRLLDEKSIEGTLEIALIDAFSTTDAVLEVAFGLGEVCDTEEVTE